MEITTRQQQTQRTLLDWLRMEYAIEKPSNKLLAVTDLDSDTWVAEVKRIRGKKQPLTAAGVQGLRDEYTRTIAPARALAAETLTLERTLSDLVNHAYGLTSAEITLMWQTAPPRMPIPHPRVGQGRAGFAAAQFPPAPPANATLRWANTARKPATLPC
jgi:hypothetical protein